MGAPHQPVQGGVVPEQIHERRQDEGEILSAWDVREQLAVIDQWQRQITWATGQKPQGEQRAFYDRVQSLVAERLHEDNTAEDIAAIDRRMRRLGVEYPKMPEAAWIWCDGMTDGYESISFSSCDLTQS